MEPSKRLAVFSIRKGKQGSIWVKLGSAFVNRDGSFNVYLDALPMDGQLHIREPGEKRETTSDAAAPASATNTWSATELGGH